MFYNVYNNIFKINVNIDFVNINHGKFMIYALKNSRAQITKIAVFSEFGL